ncbi:MAG: hypothetical protein OIN86_17625 [Candidatus Methanoperedens sp.]|nr:hypothetical protein [Candidatus Methanoperedens sp.]CAG0952169.1 hypothetical protein METP1_00252 [Methanosarcinales archaeon]
MNENDNLEIPSGLTSRVVVSIIVFFGLLIFAIIYVAFFASSFSLFQQIAIILIALLVAIAILAVMWTSWGIKYGKEWKGCK